MDDLKVTHFIHVSSVASLDGREIEYAEHLECDNAYRATKYLQEKEIRNWCNNREIGLTVVYPSAIFSDYARADTNIGKLQSVSKFIPFIPKIEVVKSLTHLPFLSQFIVDSVEGDVTEGSYLTIEKPLMFVSSMIQIIAGRPICEIKVPFLPFLLKWFANFLYVIGFFGKFDLKLTPNRVTKLFTDTSYSHIDLVGIDTTKYNSRNTQQLTEVLATLR